MSPRREFLTTCGALALAAPPVAAAEFAADDPHAAWGVEERRRRAIFNALPLDDPRYATTEEQDDADMAEFEAFDDLMKAMVTTSARTLAGVQEQVRYALYCNEEWHGDREELGDRRPAERAGDTRQPDGRV